MLNRYGGGTDWEAAVSDLRAVDAASAERIDRNDWYRLARALSVYEMSGRPFSSFLNEV